MGGFSTTNPKTPVETQRDLRRAQKQIGELQRRVEQLESSKAAAHPSMRSVASELQANGSQPLTVTALPGVLSQPQLSKITRVKDFPPPADPRVTDGFLVLKDGIVYRFDAVLVAWVPLCCGSALAVKAELASSSTSTTSAGGVLPPSSSITIFSCGHQILLSSVPFEQSPGGAAGDFLRQLYNCLQAIPGAWDLGCGSGNSFIWPDCHQLPINSSGQRYIPPALLSGSSLLDCVIISPDGQYFVMADQSLCGCSIPCTTSGHLTIPNQQYIVTSCGNQVLLSNGAFSGPSAQFLYLQYLCINSVPNGWDFGCGSGAAFVWPDCFTLPIGPNGLYYIPASLLSGGTLVSYAKISGSKVVVKDTDLCGTGGPCM